ncbi:hypothetical protein QP157_16855 [Sphingomonas sp. LR61]
MCWEKAPVEPADLDVDVRGEHARGAVDVDERADGRDAGAAPRLDADRLPDAARGDVDAPVPAEVRRVLAQCVVRVVVDVGEFAAVQGGQSLGRGDRGVEGDHELVRAGAQQVPDGEPVRAVLVRGGGDDDAVQFDRREGVESVGDEVVAGGRGRARAGLARPREGAAVPPHRVADPLGRSLVVAVERVGDAARPQQVGVHAAGDDRGDRLPVRIGLRRAVHRLDRPRAVQGGPLHCVSSIVTGP